MQSQDGDLAQLLRDDLGFGLVVVLQAPGQLLEDPRRGAPGGADEEDAVEAALVGGVAGGEGTEPAGDIVIDAEYLGPRSLPGKGNVVVYVLINEAGRAVDVDIISSSGNGSLDRWALQQARSSAYRPKTVNGEPVVSEGKIEFGS